MHLRKPLRPRAVRIASAGLCSMSTTAANGQYSSRSGSAGAHRSFLAEAEEGYPVLPWREYAHSRHPRKRQRFRSEAASATEAQSSSGSAAAFPLDRILKAPTAGMDGVERAALRFARRDPVAPGSRFPFHRRAAGQRSKFGPGYVGCAPQLASLGPQGVDIAGQTEKAKKRYAQPGENGNPPSAFVPECFGR